MGKFERIHMPAEFGLNTEDSILVENTEALKKWREQYEPKELAPVRWYSIRAAKQGTHKYAVGKTPHYPFEPHEMVESICSHLLASGYLPIIARGINPAEAELAGVFRKWPVEDFFIRRPETDWVIEAAIGPGTVRRVTHQEIIDRRWTKASHTDMPEECKVLISRLLELPCCTAEFSIYRKPVGKLNERLIVWELALQ